GSMRSGMEATKDDCNGGNDHRNHEQEVKPEIDPGLGDQRRNDAGREETETPESMSAVHDAVAEQVLGAIGFEVEDDLDAADEDAARQQQGKERAGPRRPGGNGVAEGEQRNESEDGAAIA